MGRRETENCRCDSLQDLWGLSKKVKRHRDREDRREEVGEERGRDSKVLSGPSEEQRERENGSGWCLSLKGSGYTYLPCTGG